MCLKNINMENKMLSYICNHEYSYFFKKCQVVGVGVGYKITNGFYTSKKCIAVFVIKKLPKYNISNQDLIPRFFKGFPTDVIECGCIPKCQSLTNKIRPVLGGYSIGNRNNYNSGTFACLVKDKYLYVLSNNHVLCVNNSGPIQSPILQPGVSDAGEVFENTIGHLSRFIKINYKDGDISPENTVDCALCKVIKRDFVSPKIAFIGIPKGISKTYINQKVLKVGKTTELTKGLVTYTDVSVNINISYNKTALFIDQIATSRMTERGDSGSLLLDENNLALGMFAAATTQMSIANPIDNILSDLKVTLVTS